MTTEMVEYTLMQNTVSLRRRTRNFLFFVVAFFLRRIATHFLFVSVKNQCKAGFELKELWSLLHMLLLKLH